MTRNPTRMLPAPLACGLALLVLACAGAAPPAPPPAPPAGSPDGPSLVLAYQANVQGEIEPCG